MRFTIPPSQLRLGGCRLGARVARSFSWWFWGVPGRSLGVPWNYMQVPLGRLGASGRSFGAFKSLRTNSLVWYFQQFDVRGSSWGPWGSLRVHPGRLWSRWEYIASSGNLAQGVWSPKSLKHCACTCFSHAQGVLFLDQWRVLDGHWKLPWIFGRSLGRSGAGYGRF